MNPPPGLEAQPGARAVRQKAHERIETRLVDVRGRGQSILLVQPPAESRISGGYRFNAEMYFRLAAEKRGGLIELAPNQLHRLMLEQAERDTTLVFDSLYLNYALSEAMASWLVERRGHCGLILHYLPSMSPGLSEHAVEKSLAMETRWLRAAGTVLVTGPRMEENARRLYSSLEAVAIAQPGVGPEFRRRDRSKAREAKGPLRMVSVGTVHSAKNQMMILEALAARGCDSFEWDIAGDLDADPTYVRTFRIQVDALGWRDRVRIWGALAPSEVAILFDRADLYVSGSRFESYGMATAEAACRGVPVVGFAVGAAPDWIENDRNGRLFPISKPDDFMDYLERLIRHPDQALELERTLPLSFPTWDAAYETFLTALNQSPATPSSSK